MEKRGNFSIMLRYAVVIFVMLCAAGMIIYKLVDTTIITADRWNERARKEFSETVPIAPQRGDILAADGSILATNMLYHTVRIDFTSGPFKEERLVAALDSLVDSLSVHFPIKTRAQWRGDFERELAKEKKERSKSYKLVEGISYADYVKLRTFPFLNLPNKYHCGVVLETHERRVNPYGKMARRSIGVVSQTKEDPEKHGRWGLERSLDHWLYGKPGVAKKIPLTKRIDTWTDVPAQPGYDITTTIDINLQEMVETELSNGLEYCGADWGVAVLMDVKTGDIKAISNLEKNPSGYGYIEALNRAVQGYEPGSVVKTLSMMIALEDGIVNEYSTIETGARWAYDGGKPITDTHISATKVPREVISHSSNIGMARIITSRYGKDPGAFYSRLKSLGLFEPMNSGIAGELNPRIDSLPNNRFGRIALSRMSYGYTTEFSPLWTLSIYNAIANGGRYVRPRLVSRISNDEGFDSIIPVSYIRDRICSEDNARLLRNWLADVIVNPQGTGRALRSTLVELAGKTGTCYIIEGGQYNQTAKRLAFCGFFPAQNPVYSCIVLVSKPTQNAFGAAGTSGNIFRSIAHKLYARGLLNNSSDYQASFTDNTYPTFFASLDPSRNDYIRSNFNITGKKSTIRPPLKVDKGVPDVTGYGLRDAIRVLEGAGYNVESTGAGFVYSQSPAPGGTLRRGEKVTLALHP